MNNLDKQYTELLQDILDNGVKKEDRTGTGTISVFGRQIRHNMKDGFPLLTTKKMAWNQIVTELLWFLRGDTNIKYLVDNDCHIWDGDAWKSWVTKRTNGIINTTPEGNARDYLLKELIGTKEEFINKIKTDNEFAKKWGNLGSIYGKQWRDWKGFQQGWNEMANTEYSNDLDTKGIDQITNLINDLKTNPDSRRLMVNAWNVGELDQMVLPPCHYSWQIYTRELSVRERLVLWYNNSGNDIFPEGNIDSSNLDKLNVPKRAISLMWNQRSVDTFLGLPFNIASYGLLLEIIAKAVNMVPDQLIGNLGDVHLYSNHIEQAKEQIGRKLIIEERVRWAYDRKLIDYVTMVESEELDRLNVPTHSRQPYPLPTLNINTEFWPTEGGECGVGPIDAIAVFNSFSNDNFCKCLLEEDIQLENYQSHPTIKAPLSN